MKLFIKLRNKYFTILMSLALLIMASIGLFNLSVPSTVEASMVKFDKETTITINNGSFATFASSASYPYSLSNYTNSGNKTSSMKAGAINVSDSVYAKNYEKYGLTEYGNPKGTGTDNYVLMINTEEDSNYTYTSSEFTLPANGIYYVTVSAKTIGDSSVASVFLMQNNRIFENCLIENISTGAWTNYTFFIATNTYESLTLKFGMQIGSPSTRASGCVLFDELHAGQISMQTLSDYMNSGVNPSTYVIKEFRSPNAYLSYNFDNQIINHASDTTIDDNYFDSSSSGGGKKSVDVSNNQMTISTTNTYVAYKGKEEILQPNSVYRFSIKAKLSQVSSGSAFVRVDEILDKQDIYDDFMDSTKDELTAKSSNLTISSVTSNKIDNDYEEYVIYVNTNTNVFNDIKVQFSFGLGSDSTNATGVASFKEYAIERVPYSAYSSASTGSKVGKIDLSDRIKLASSSYSNYTFDKMQSESFDGVPYPATPSDWTKAQGGNGYQLSGVVNLSQFDDVMNKYSKELNKMATPKPLNNTLNNNVLMIYNGTNSYQTYTSASKSLTANKYYKITTYVNTQLWDKDANGATIVAKTGSTVLGKIENIKTEGEWQRVEMYINTPKNNVSVTIELALGYGENLSSGYAFFDNILVQNSDTEGKFSTIFDEGVVADNGSLTIDLTNPMLTLNSNVYRDFNAPVLYSGNNKTNNTINAGIVDLSKDLKSIIAEDKMEALTKVGGNNTNVLAIATVLNKDSRYEFTSVLNYSFDSGKYYKLSFEVFTDNIGQEDKEQKYDNGKLAEGVNIELTGLENAKFNYIVSNGKWTTYEYYIGVNSSATSNLVFSLGSEFTGCYGRAFLGNINLVEVEENEFTTAELNDTRLKVNTVEQPEEEEIKEDKEKSNGFSWVYIPTILTFLAIVVAVVGVFMRRNIKFKKRVGNKKVNYDRDITVMQNKYRRLASDRRDKEVRELTKECNELIALRSEFEEKYKEALSRLRSAKLSNRDGSKRHEIAAIEHEVKHISKEVARYGVQVNNYENEIEFMQTEAYLISIEKRMMRDAEIARNQVRKEATMPEEKRLEAIKKREAKQARAQEKTEIKAEKLAVKQAKLEATRKAVQQQLETAKQKDEQLIKEQELLRIKVEEAKLAKEKAKAEKLLKKLEQEKASHEAEKKQIEQEIAKNLEEQAEEEIIDNEQATEEIETIESQTEKIENVTETEEAEVVEPVEQTAETTEEIKEVAEQPVETVATENSETINEQAQNDNESNDNE